VPINFNPNYAVGFVMRFKRTKNQRVMDEKHPDSYRDG